MIPFIGLDIRHALRGLRASPGLVVAGILSLGLGVTGAGFSFVETIRLRRTFGRPGLTVPSIRSLLLALVVGQQTLYGQAVEVRFDRPVRISSAYPGSRFAETWAA